MIVSYFLITIVTTIHLLYYYLVYLIYYLLHHIHFINHLNFTVLLLFYQRYLCFDFPITLGFLNFIIINFLIIIIMAYYLQFLILFLRLYHLPILIHSQYLITFDYLYRIPIILIIFILSLCHITRLIILECFPNLILKIHYVMFIL